MLTAFGLRAGDVLSWNDCPFRAKKDEPLKKRWFIVLGYFTIEEQIFVVTTTTRQEHYGVGKPRESHVYFRLPAGSGGLIQDSIVDLSQDFQEIHLSGLERSKSDIIKEGTLKQETVNTLVKHLEKTNRISKIVKKRIYECLKDVGFRINR
ncbi:MAG: hypothetical protein LBI40_03520 [Treponema sp.]|jgi:hypothetical protein|nr:hypothetical protein [Treponema sp.]